MLSKIAIKTEPGASLMKITEELAKIKQDDGLEEGVCVLNVPHTTTGLTLNSIVDSARHQDALNEINYLLPARPDFENTFDTPLNAACLIKSSLVAMT